MLPILSPHTYGVKHYLPVFTFVDLNLASSDQALRCEDWRNGSNGVYISYGLPHMGYSTAKKTPLSSCKQKDGGQIDTDVRSAVPAVRRHRDRPSAAYQGERRDSVRRMSRPCSTLGAGRQFLGLADKEQQHVDLVLDLHFAVNVPYMRLDRAGSDIQALGNTAIPESLTDKLGNLLLARRQLISPAQIRPLFGIKKHRQFSRTVPSGSYRVAVASRPGRP